MKRPLQILLIGDIIGRPGRRTIAKRIEQIRAVTPVDFIVANGENAAGGFGLTPRVADEIRAAGVDVITSGNHIYNKSDILVDLDRYDDILRPANYPRETPGNGVGYYPLPGDVTIAVINLQGRVLMPWIACPFTWVEENLDTVRKRTPVILIDFHAEATAEKNAMAWYVNGKVSIVYGTHTHVATADLRILPSGHTAYMTDVGMTGPYHSVIGMKVEKSIQRLRTQFPRRLEVARGPCIFSALLVAVDPESGRALHVQHILELDQAAPE